MMKSVRISGGKGGEKHACLKKDFLWGGTAGRSKIITPVIDETAFYPSREGIRHYQYFKEDIRLFAEMGFKVYRFSIAWTRMFVASAKAVRMAHEIDPACRVGNMMIYSASYPLSSKPEDVLECQRYNQIFNYFCSDVQCRGKYPFYSIWTAILRSRGLW